MCHKAVALKPPSLTVLKRPFLVKVYKYEWENIQYFTGELTASVSRGGKGGYESHI